MPTRFRKDMFNSDSSDDEYYFEPDKIEDDASASDSGNKLRSTRNRLRCFNICSDSDSDDELNIEEKNTSVNKITQTFNVYIFSTMRANTSRPQRRSLVERRA